MRVRRRRDPRVGSRSPRGCAVATALLVAVLGSPARAGDGADAWIAADAALAKGDEAAAREAAAALDDEPRRRLSRYIDARRGMGRQEAEREAMREAKSLLASGSAGAAVLIIVGARVEADTVLAVVAAETKAEALKGDRRPGEAARALFDAAKTADRIGWVERAIWDANAAGLQAFAAHDLSFARGAWEQELRWAEGRFGDGPLAKLHNAIGTANFEMGALSRARGDFERSAAIAMRHGPTLDAAQAYMNLGNVHTQLGQLAAALSAYDRALDVVRRTPGGGAETEELRGEITMHRALALLAIPAEAEAEAGFRAAIEVLERVGDPEIVAMAHGNLCLALVRLERFDEAHAAGKQALAFFETRGRPDLVAQALCNLAEVESARARHELAATFLRGAIERTAAVGNPVELLSEQCALGRALRAAGHPDEALASLQAALTDARALGAQASVVDLEAAIALAHFDLFRSARRGADVASGKTAAEEAQKTLAEAKACMESIEGPASGLADVQEVAARAARAEVFDAGVLAAAFLNRPDAAASILEAARAGSLRAALGGREALWSAVIPEELAASEQSARANENDAYAEWLDATKSKVIARIAAARKAWDAARGATLAVVERIQREAEQAANLVYAAPDGVEKIRAALAPGDALVEFALCDDESVAIVLRKDGPAAMARLGATKPIVDACADLLAGDPVDPTKIGALRDLVMKPLGLGPTTKRVLVSPDGVLARVPFALLDDTRAIAYAPSGTVLGLLQRPADGGTALPVDRTAARVVALGDPDYASTVRAGESMRGRSLATRLVPLPATRAEAEAVGDTILLGGGATEAWLRATIPSGGRPLRSLHLACHGLLRESQPSLSALAVTAGGGDDGLLTVHEILRMKIRADLVVLSACESARGPVVKGEGVLGLARAFMFAGAPRVIGSLWRVDDDATKELMVRFYERWKPGGTGAAECLRRAQAEVRAIVKWSHPRYWAAWVLWGLPD